MRGLVLRWWAGAGRGIAGACAGAALVVVDARCCAAGCGREMLARATGEGCCCEMVGERSCCSGAVLLVARNSSGLVGRAVLSIRKCIFIKEKIVILHFKSY